MVQLTAVLASVEVDWAGVGSGDHHHLVGQHLSHLQQKSDRRHCGRGNES